MLRPADCDGDHCDYNDRGIWRCLPGCLSLTGQDTDGEDDARWLVEHPDAVPTRPRRGAACHDERPRLLWLYAAICKRGGEWTTGLVWGFYRERGIPAPRRATARRDLAQLHRRGLLDQHGPANARSYTPKGSAA